MYDDELNIFNDPYFDYNIDADVTDFDLEDLVHDFNKIHSSVGYSKYPKKSQAIGNLDLYLDDISNP
jgi:hypothetical protein